MHVVTLATISHVYVCIYVCVYVFSVRVVL
jgi:hypothetical protein